jgi:hypothetical protein
MAESNRLIVSDNERINIYNRYFIDKGGSSTGDQIHKCGIHDFETRNLKEFNDHLNMTHNDGIDRTGYVYYRNSSGIWSQIRTNDQ